MTIPGSAISLLSAGSAAGYEIERSLRFNSDDSAYLNRTPSSAGNRRTWTWSGWLKKCAEDANAVLFSRSADSSNRYVLSVYLGNFYFYSTTSGSVTLNVQTSGKFRDPSAWYHVVFAFDTTQASANDRTKIYVNGVQQTLTYTTQPSQNADFAINTAAEHRVGGDAGSSEWLNGYLTEVQFVDGQALDPTDFGEFDDNGVWQPIEYAGTYGTNGFHLPFSDNSSVAALGTDTSGNGNTWTVNNISVTAGAGNDSLFDSPQNGTQTDTGAGGEVSGNYCTLNSAIDPAYQASNGALEFTSPASAWESAFGTMVIPSYGKWYYEVVAPDEYTLAGISDATGPTIANYLITFKAISYVYYFFDGKKYQGPAHTPTAYGATGTTGDVMGVAIDMDAGTLTFYKNGTSQGTAFTGLTGSYIPVVCAYENTQTVNFGQRAFAHAAPSGYKALCTANLDDPTIADGSTVMDVALYTGNGSTQTISGLDFSPDLVWIKNRAQADSHKLLDTVRGATNELESNTIDAEVANADGLTAFNSNGFALGADAEYNTNSEAYVAWAWNAGTSTVTNTDGSITSQVRANPDAGFSIVKVTMPTATSSTIGHGLNAVPAMWFWKPTTFSNGWFVWHHSLPITSFLRLQTADQEVTNNNIWNNTNPTSSVLSTGNAFSGYGDQIIYCFAPVEGYSAFGSYVGNGSATDGPFVYTGFRPRWVMIKRTDSGPAGWPIWDTMRGVVTGGNDAYVSAQSTGAEFNGADDIEFNANGFRLTSTAGLSNAASGNYIYAAFAEHPFKTARAR